MPALLTRQCASTLLANGRRQQRSEDSAGALDFMPVVKIFTPDAACTWLLTELDPDDPDRAFGLCDLGLGFPELGWVRLSQLARLRGRLGLPAERDRHFRAAKPLSAYAAEAARARRIRT